MDMIIMSHLSDRRTCMYVFYYYFRMALELQSNVYGD